MSIKDDKENHNYVIGFIVLCSLTDPFNNKTMSWYKQWIVLESKMTVKHETLSKAQFQKSITAGVQIASSTKTPIQSEAQTFWWSIKPRTPEAAQNINVKQQLS